MPFLLTINTIMDALYKYCGYTLIDITKTDVLDNRPDHSLQRNQQRNWETVYQILSLRAQLLDFKYLGYIEEDLSNFSFGINYQGLHRIWQFEFAVEHDGIYNIDADRYGTLKDDFKITPIILGLTETASPNIPLFYASGSDKNIYFIAAKTE